MTIIVLLLAAGMFDRTTAIDKQWVREAPAAPTAVAAGAHARASEPSPP